MYLSLFSLLGLLLFSTVHADTVFSTGNYKNNAYKDQILQIPDAIELEVQLQGETEKVYDKIIIYDNQNNKVGEFSGKLDETLKVTGSSIRVIFKADNRTTKSGAQVIIKQRTTDVLLKEVKEKLSASVNNILKKGTGQLNHKIGLLAKEFKALSAQVASISSEEELVSTIAHVLVKLANVYRELVVEREVILKQHQAELEIISSLRNQIIAYNRTTQNSQQNYAQKINQAKTALHDTESELQKQDKYYEMSAWEITVKALYSQQKMWEKLQQDYADLIIHTQTYMEKIQLFFAFLQRNAHVYEQIANAALLSKSTIPAFNDITHVDTLKEIVQGINENEQHIQEILHKIVK